MPRAPDAPFYPLNFYIVLIDQQKIMSVLGDDDVNNPANLMRVASPGRGLGGNHPLSGNQGNNPVLGGNQGNNPLGGGNQGINPAPNGNQTAGLPIGGNQGNNLPPSGILGAGSGLSGQPASHADQFNHLSFRMDSMADQINQLMRAMTPLLNQVPNITGWPLARSLPQPVGGANPRAPPPVGSNASVPSVGPSSIATATVANPPNTTAQNPSQPARISGSGTASLNGPLNLAAVFTHPPTSGVQPAWANHSTPVNTGPPNSVHGPLNLGLQQVPQQTQSVHPPAQQQLLGLPNPGNPSGGLPAAPLAVAAQPPAAPYTAAFPAAGSAAQQYTPNGINPILQTPQHFQNPNPVTNLNPLTNGVIPAYLTRPRGDAHDSDDDLSVVTPDGEGSSSASGSRGRGRTRAYRSRRERRQERNPSSNDDDPGDDYAENRKRLEKDPKSLTIKEFSPGGKEVFDIFIGKFEGVVNKGTNPHSKKRHDKYCLQWLPLYLDSEAYTVWKRSPHRKSNWEELKKELRREFEDPIIRSEWKGNLRAYVWDETKETLHTYCSKVKGYVDTFEEELADGSKAKLDQYYLRFKSGLPDDYQDQIRMAMPTHKQSIEKAYDVALRYQATKKGKTSKGELGATVSFEDPSMPARVTQNETNIIRLKNRMAKLEQSPNPGGSQQSTASTGNQTQSKFSRYNGNSPHRSGGGTSDFSSDSTRTNDRRKRFNDWRNKRYGPRRPNSNKNDASQNTQSQSLSSSQKQSSNIAAASLFQNQLDDFSQTEGESGAETADDTINDFAAYMREEEERMFAEFCALTDEARVNGLPGRINNLSGNF